MQIIVIIFAFDEGNIADLSFADQLLGHPERRRVPAYLADHEVFLLAPHRGIDNLAILYGRRHGFSQITCRPASQGWQNDSLDQLRTAGLKKAKAQFAGSLFPSASPA